MHTSTLQHPKPHTRAHLHHQVTALRRRLCQLAAVADDVMVRLVEAGHGDLPHVCV